MRKLEPQIRCCLAALFLALPSVAAAQLPSTTAVEPGYPSRAIRIIVPFPPGGPTDLYARIIAQKLQDRWTQPVVVDNRAGGTGQIGTSLVQQSAPDGLLKGGSELIANTPEQFAEDIREEQKVWARVIREKGIKAE